MKTSIRWQQGGKCNVFMTLSRVSGQINLLVLLPSSPSILPPAFHIVRSGGDSQASIVTNGNASKYRKQLGMGAGQVTKLASVIRITAKTKIITIRKLKKSVAEMKALY